MCKYPVKTAATAHSFHVLLSFLCSSHSPALHAHDSRPLAFSRDGTHFLPRTIGRRLLNLGLVPRFFPSWHQWALPSCALFRQSCRIAPALLGADNVARCLALLVLPQSAARIASLVLQAITAPTERGHLLSLTTTASPSERRCWRGMSSLPTDKRMRKLWRFQKLTRRQKI